DLFPSLLGGILHVATSVLDVVLGLPDRAADVFSGFGSVVLDPTPGFLGALTSGVGEVASLGLRPLPDRRLTRTGSGAHAILHDTLLLPRSLHRRVRKSCATRNARRPIAESRAANVSHRSVRVTMSLTGHRGVRNPSSLSRGKPNEVAPRKPRERINEA